MCTFSLCLWFRVRKKTYGLTTSLWSKIEPNLHWGFFKKPPFLHSHTSSTQRSFCWQKKVLCNHKGFLTALKSLKESSIPLKLIARVTFEGYSVELYTDQAFLLRNAFFFCKHFVIIISFPPLLLLNSVFTLRLHLQEQKQADGEPEAEGGGGREEEQCTETSEN